jgi:hypothetical protein
MEGAPPQGQRGEAPFVELKVRAAYGAGAPLGWLWAPLR